METKGKAKGGGARNTPAPDVTKKKGRKRNWTNAFLEAFRMIGVVAPAAAAAGVSRWAVAKRCERDQTFAKRYNAALQDSTERLEAIAVARASRESNPSDNLLMFLLKARRPEKYRDQFRSNDDSPIIPPAGSTVIDEATVVILPSDGFQDRAAEYVERYKGHPAEPGTAGTVPVEQG